MTQPPQDDMEPARSKLLAPSAAALPLPSHRALSPRTQTALPGARQARFKGAESESGPDRAKHLGAGLISPLGDRRHVWTRRQAPSAPPQPCPLAPSPLACLAAQDARWAFAETQDAWIHAGPAWPPCPLHRCRCPPAAALPSPLTPAAGSTFCLGLSMFAVLFLSVLASLIHNGYPYAGAHCRCAARPQPPVGPAPVHCDACADVNTTAAAAAAMPLTSHHAPPCVQASGLRPSRSRGSTWSLSTSSER